MLQGRSVSFCGGVYADLAQGMLVSLKKIGIQLVDTRCW